MASERRRPRYDPDERFKLDEDDPEEALRRLLRVEVPLDEDDVSEGEDS